MLNDSMDDSVNYHLLLESGGFCDSLICLHLAVVWTKERKLLW